MSQDASPERKLICLVDDDDLFRAKLALELRAEGYEVVEVDDGRQVGTVLASRAFDAVVLDLVMPERDGLEIIADIKRVTPRTHIVAISGGGRVGAQLYLELARQLGADACLAKPIKIESLKAAIG